MKSYDLHIFWDSDGRACASVTMGEPDKYPPTLLRLHELDAIANVATRSACGEAIEPPRADDTKEGP